MRPAHAWANRVTRCASSSVSSDGTFAVSMHVVSIRWRQPLELASRRTQRGPEQDQWKEGTLAGAKFPAIRPSLARESGRFVIFETAERKAPELFPADNVSKPEPLGGDSFTERQLRC